MMEARSTTSCSSVSALVGAVLFMLLTVPGAAHAAELRGSLQLAYVDPATGSLIIQAVLAALAAVAVTTRMFWTKIKGWFGFAPASRAEDGDLTPTADPNPPPKDG